MKSITKQQVAKYGSPGWTGVAVTAVGIWNSTLGLLELDGAGAPLQSTLAHLKMNVKESA